MAAKAVKIVYIFKTEYNIFFGNEYTPFSEDIYIPEKGIYFSGKNIILFRQKVYTFLSKSIYFLGKKYILFSRKKQYSCIYLIFN